MKLILASQSVARRAMLENVGVIFDVVRAPVDEEAAKAAFRADGLTARNLADALAELKAVRVSLKHPGALVIGCDQTLALADGTMLDKAADLTALAQQLTAMSGQRHTLFSAAVVAHGGQPVWRLVEAAHLTVRTLSPQFIDDYVQKSGQAVVGCLGGYRIEADGALLFSSIEGSHFAVMGLPLLGLLDYLRVRGVLAA